VPGRATSLASVGVLLGLAGLAVIVSATGVAPGVSAAGTAGTNAGAQHPSPGAQTVGSTVPALPKSPVTGSIKPEPAVTQSFRCPAPRRPGSKQVSSIPALTAKQAGSAAVTATTFCRSSSWYVSESLGAIEAAPFRVPDDPPIPALVPVEGFVPVIPRSVPAVLVRRDKFPNAALYEMFTLAGSGVVPVAIAPGGSPVLLLKAASQLQGAGFTCTPTRSGEVIRQYEWYVVDPTTLETSSTGAVVGNPAVYLETTIYTAQTDGTFSSNTLAIAQLGYNFAESLVDDSC